MNNNRCFSAAADSKLVALNTKDQQPYFKATSSLHYIYFLIDSQCIVSLDDMLQKNALDTIYQKCPIP